MSGSDPYWIHCALVREVANQFASLRENQLTGDYGLIRDRKNRNYSEEM